MKFISKEKAKDIVKNIIEKILDFKAIVIRFIHNFFVAILNLLLRIIFVFRDLGLGVWKGLIAIKNTCVKFVKREIKRGNKYDAIIMDPPSYGRGANGEVWSIEKDLEGLLELCVELLSNDAEFVVINTYTGGLSGTVISNLLTMVLQASRKDLIKKGRIVTDEIGIKMENSSFVLPCGITTKWENGGI